VVILREARVGLLLGAALGLLALGPAWIFAGRQIGFVVSLTLLAVCTLAAFVGALLPLVARRVRVDPAVMSAPFITTLVDASGLIIYFLIARAVLGL
jgi:magnesium transporter